MAQGGTVADEQVIIHSVPSLHVGGVNKALIVTLEGLAKGPHRHVVCVLGENLLLAPEIESLGVPVVSLGHRRSTDALRTLLRFRRLVRAQDATVVHSHQPLSRTYGGLVARSCGLPSIATLHGTRARDYLTETDGVGRRLRLTSGMWVGDTLLTTRFVAVSKAVASAFLAHHPRAARRIVVIPNGVAVDAVVPPDAPPDADLRRELRIPDSAPVLVNVGRLVPEKDQVTLVPMMTEVLRSHPDAVLIVAGRGDEGRRIQDAVDRAGLGDAIHLLGLRTDVPALLHLADLVVVSSVSEGFSVAVLEAMASGRAVVATDLDAIAEAVRDGIDGLLVPPRNPSALAGAVCQLLDDPDRRTAMGAAGRARATGSFSAAATTAALERLYVELGRGGTEGRVA